MFTNYFKIAMRNLLKHKFFSLINIMGLAIGIAAAILIVEYVSFEHSYDEFIPHSQDLYRIYAKVYQDNTLRTQAATIYPALGPALKAELPEVEETGRLVKARGVILYGDKKFLEDRIYHADASIPSLFGLTMEEGDVKTALLDPGTVIISKTIAKKYFGEDSPLGKSLQLSAGVLGSNISERYIVQGVFNDIPSNTHFPIDMLFSYKTFARTTLEAGLIQAEQSWSWYDFYTYVKLKPMSNLADVQSKMPALIQKYRGDILRKRNMREEWFLQPVRDIHLNSELSFEASPSGNVRSVNILLLIAGCVLLIAWVNYISLSTARATQRAKEVGLRKIVGAARTQLVQQFVIESWIINIFSLVAAIAIVELAHSSFYALIGHAGKKFFTNGTMSYWIGFGALMLTGNTITSIYPALILSTFKPIIVLKGRFTSSSSGLLIRKGLTVFQFGAAVAMVSATLIIFQQLRFMRNHTLGFNLNQTLVIKSEGAQDQTQGLKAEEFRMAVSTIPGVRGSSVSTYIPGDDNVWATAVRPLESDRSFTMYTSGVDEEFLHNFDIGLIAGRSFSKQFPSDHKAVILNEEALRLMNIRSPEEALNRRVVWRNIDTLTVIGVMANFHNRGLKLTMDPVVFRLIDSEYRYFSIKMSAENTNSTIEHIKNIYDKLFPTDSFTYFFLDEYFNRQYRADEQFASVFGLFAFLAIGVACLGILGLATYSATQRTREIGVRKVLGASIPSIVGLLSKDFVQLVVIANLIAWPVAYYSMNVWLQDFAFRTTIEVWTFVLAGTLALIIAFFTVSYQALKAALSNPVEALRYE